MRLPPIIRRIVVPGIYLRAVAFHDYWWGEPELRLLTRIIDPQLKAVDVGANYGVYSFYLSRIVPEVYAFEPNPGLTGFIKQSARRNVTLFPLALSDTEGVAQLIVPKDSRGEIHGRGSLNASEQGDRINRISVRTSTLDALKLNKIGFIKIDVEGHELSVLRGARATLAEYHPRLLIEMDWKHVGDALQGEFDEILGLGYDGYFYWSGRLHSLSTFDRSVHQNQTPALASVANYVQNFIFIHKQDVIQMPQRL